MEPIEVIAHFNQQGTITPLQFTWKGNMQHVESTGRRWTDEAGIHILVMVAGGRIHELIYQPAEGCWYRRRAQAGRTYA